MDINALTTFLEVAKTRHFGKAAETLFVSQSTVSARIKTLEDALGAPLFVREPSNIHLTTAGEAFITHAKSMMTLWSRAKLEIVVPDEIRKTLAVGGLPGLWDITLQDWLFQLSQSHPELAIYADIYNAETLYTRVLEGSIDVAFLYDAPQGVNLGSRQLNTIDLRLVASSPCDKLDEDWFKDFVQVDWGFNFAVEFAAKFPQINHAKMTTGLGRIALEYLKRGKGYAYLAEPAVREAIDAGKVHYVPNSPIFKRKAFAIYHIENDKTDLIEELIEGL